MKKSTSILTIISGIVGIAFIIYCFEYLAPRYGSVTGEPGKEGAWILTVFVTLPAMLLGSAASALSVLPDLILGGIGLKKIGSIPTAVLSAVFTLFDLISAIGMILIGIFFNEFFVVVLPFIFALFLVIVVAIRYQTLGEALKNRKANANPVLAS